MVVQVYNEVLQVYSEVVQVYSEGHRGKMKNILP